jgi:hypothetical protein
MVARRKIWSSNHCINYLRDRKGALTDSIIVGAEQDSDIGSGHRRTFYLIERN